MSTTRGIRHRLLTILLLGALTSALSLAALVLLLTTTTKQRVERVHEGVAEEVDKIAHAAAPIAEPYTTWVGLHGGTWTREKGPSVAPPEEWANALRRVAKESAARGGRVVDEIAIGDSELVI
ncbi:MAG TPA: hypothetical protein VGI39_35025, partial [Polyangiaceae bacterium]